MSVGCSSLVVCSFALLVFFSFLCDVPPSRGSRALLAADLLRRQETRPPGGGCNPFPGHASLAPRTPGAGLRRRTSSVKSRDRAHSTMGRSGRSGRRCGGFACAAEIRGGLEAGPTRPDPQGRKTAPSAAAGNRHLLELHLSVSH